MIKISEKKKLVLKNLISLDTYNLRDQIKESLEKIEIDLVLSIDGIEIREIEPELEEEE